jgi:hypothetical protein
MELNNSNICLKDQKLLYYLMNKAAFIYDHRQDLFFSFKQL